MSTDTISQKPGLGWFAIAWIGFMIVASAWVAYRIGVTIEDLVSHADPRWKNDLYWALPTLMGLAALNILSLGVLLSRRKIGFYLFLLATVAAAAINVYIGVPVTTMLISLIGLGVLGVIIYTKWHVLK